MYDLAENNDFDRESIATYEEVAKLFPRPGVYRPIILIGAPGKLNLTFFYKLFNNHLHTLSRCWQKRAD